MRNGRILAEAPMHYAGETSEFEGELTPPEPGNYELQVIGMEPSKTNFGMDRQAIHIGG